MYAARKALKIQQRNRSGLFCLITVMKSRSVELTSRCEKNSLCFFYKFTKKNGQNVKFLSFAKLT